MQYTIPDYYKEFTCIADKCEDTCCAGWKIVIDKKSLNKYKHVKGKFWFTMLKSVDWIRGIFRQDKEKRCAFLNDCNLCEMYVNLGEKSLCKTCRLYPRHVEEFEDVREITLSVSCPEVARILMEKKEPVRFLTYEKEGEEELMTSYPNLKVRVLKAGHHGSKDSSSEAFLDQLKPSLALVSAGENNRYKHPNDETLERFKERHIKVLRTDQDGAIRFKGWFQLSSETVR